MLLTTANDSHTGSHITHVCPTPTTTPDLIASSSTGLGPCGGVGRSLGLFAVLHNKLETSQISAINISARQHPDTIITRLLSASLHSAFHRLPLLLGQHKEEEEKKVKE